jgi:phenylpropionate dioxygenase-like ring-hydroxylating dioxygenase large terminal subunit
MNVTTDPKGKGGKSKDAGMSQVRPDFVPTEHYTSPEFLKLEGERLWPKVWQIACREEELPHVGSYVTYQIMNDSIVVVRTEKGLRAYFNVCQHRGRRLVSGCGQIKKFHCMFHGWQWNLDGSNARVVDKQDWDGCPDFSDEDIRLPEVKVDSWGGWVFINMDPNCEPLLKYLDPLPKFLDPFELQKMRYRWYVSIKVPCNWKVGLEAFDEAYHNFGTHTQIMPTFGDDVTRCMTFGKHGRFYYPGNPEYPMGRASPRLGNQPPPKDYRVQIITYLDQMDRELNAFFSKRSVEAARRLMTEVDPNVSAGEAFMKAVEFQKEAAIATGAGWPPATLEDMANAATDWHVFPNHVFLPYFDGVLAYRVTPHATDPGWCYFDVFALQRYAPGAEPPLQRKILYGDEDWKNFRETSIILQQDFDNMGEVQAGMRSRGFKGARTNPLQETVVSNFHRALMEYLDGSIK